MPKGVWINWTQLEEDYIRYCCRGRADKYSVVSFNWIFGRDVSRRGFSSKRKRMGVSTGSNGRFRKGQKAFNKGLKQSDYMSAEAIERTIGTRFQKSHTPWNFREVGSERTDRDGFILIKTDDQSKGIHGWRTKQDVLYEEYHGCELAEDDVVIFNDGDRHNFDIDNLELISRAEHLMMNRMGLRSGIREATETGLTLARLVLMNNERKKNKKGGRIDA